MPKRIDYQNGDKIEYDARPAGAEKPHWVDGWTYIGPAPLQSEVDPEEHVIYRNGSTLVVPLKRLRKEPEKLRLTITISSEGEIIGLDAFNKRDQHIVVAGQKLSVGIHSEPGSRTIVKRIKLSEED